MEKNVDISLESQQKCSICYNFYTSYLMPYVLSCGHTYCSQCVYKIYNQEEKYIRCPYDKSIIEYNSFDKIPINFSYLHLLQAISKFRLNDRCKFERELLKENLESESKLVGVEEISKSKSIIELQFLQKHPWINETKALVYEKKQKSLNGATIYQYFQENKKFKNIIKKLYENGEYFEGIFQYGKKHGWGIKRYESGYLFEGFFVNGNKEGFGIEISKFCDIYIGQFENNLKSGYGVLLYNKTGVKYKGKFYMNKKEGMGEEHFSDKSVYKGYFVHGMRSGEGLITYPNGNFLQGQFLNGKINGKGKEKTETYKYKGFFREGVKHGEGVIVYENGSMFKGTFQNGKPNGRGIFKYSNGNLYDGEWVNGRKEGMGKLQIVSKTDANSVFLTYEGGFSNDFFEGNGELVINNRTTYRGEFKQGLKSGFGILTYPNGDEYRGSFKNDMKDGHGEIFYVDSGRVIEGTWINNKLDSMQNDCYFSDNMPDCDLDNISNY